jgi:hypothetical protein
VVAEMLEPYVERGCRSISLLAVGADRATSLEGVAEVARLLRTSRASLPELVCNFVR